MHILLPAWILWLGPWIDLRPPQEPKPHLSDPVIEALAVEEDKSTRGDPGPSRHLIAFLLRGLSAGLPESADLDEAARRKLTGDPRGKIFPISPMLRVSIGIQWFQDKSGTSYQETTRLHELKDGEWTLHISVTGRPLRRQITCFAGALR